MRLQQQISQTAEKLKQGWQNSSLKDKAVAIAGSTIASTIGLTGLTWTAASVADLATPELYPIPNHNLLLGPQTSAMPKAEREEFTRKYIDEICYLYRINSNSMKHRD